MSDQLFWAFYSKLDRDSDDTRVLATSPTPGPGGGTVTDLVQSMYSMRPPTRSPAAGPLPIASFGPPRPVAGPPWLAVCLVEPVEHQFDASKRTFHRASLYALPYAVAARDGITHAALLDHVLLHPLAPSSTEPVPAPLPRADPAPVALIERLGADWCIATAAVLLEGPVTVVGAGDLDVRTRADVLDAVMALLPFGFRASVMAATDAEPGPPFRSRLSFGADPGAGAAVELGRVPRPRFAEALAYREVVDRFVRRHSLPELLAFLAADRRPCDIDDLDVVRALPEMLDELMTQWAEARAGKLGPGPARMLIDRLPITSAAQLTELVGPLLTAAVTPWDSSAAGWLDATWGQQLVPALACVLPAWPSAAQAATYELVDGRGNDELAAEMLRTGSGYDLLYAAADARATVRSYHWLAESARSIPAWADALRQLVTGAGEVTGATLARVRPPGTGARATPAALVRVLTVAAAHQRLAAISPDGWRVLADAVGDPVAQGALSAELNALATDSAGDARLDALRSAVDRRILLADPRAVTSAGHYVAELLTGLGCLHGAGWSTPSRADVATAVVDRWRREPDPAAWAILLAVASHLQDEAAAAVVRAIDASGALLTGEGPWDHLEELVPDLGQRRAELRLAAVLHDAEASAGDVGTACSDAVARKVPVAVVLAGLGTWRPAEKPETVDGVLRAMTKGAGLRGYLTVADAVWSGAAGPIVGPRHRAWSMAQADRKLAEVAAAIDYVRGVQSWRPGTRQDG